MKKEKCKIYDLNNNHIDSIYEGDTILRKESQDLIEATEIWKIENFNKGNLKEIRQLLDDLSVNEKALLFSMSAYIGYTDCCIKYDNGRCLNSEALIKISKFSKSVFYDTLKKLIKKDIIYKGKNSTTVQYFINPWIFCKGQRINKVLKTMFANYKIRILNKQWKDITDYDLKNTKL